MILPLLRRASVALAVLTLVPAAAAQLASSGDPAAGEVPLPCAEGWDARLIIDNGATGIWTVKSFQVFDTYAVPEVVGLDDQGRCLIMVSYSGKWTPVRAIEDKVWLGALDHGDVDPRIDGAELYTGGKAGFLYQVVPYPFGHTDHRRIAEFPGRELHTLVAGEFDPRSPGAELLVFTRPGGLFRVAPTGEHGTWETVELEEPDGRVRDAVVLPPAQEGGPARVACVSRSGWVRILTIGAEGCAWETVFEGPVGRGRLAVGPPAPGGRLVLYSGQDDGAILRHEERPGGGWSTETIFLGPQGTRGVVAGEFDDDPATETVAVFGYSGRVQMLTRRGGAWSARTIFEDRDRGHWLGLAEVDSRNGTQEIVGSGYGGRIFLLTRPPGYGRPGIPTDADAAPMVPAEPESAGQAADGTPAGGRVLRVAVRAGAQAAQGPDPSSYVGGFPTKTLALETLVARAADGRFVAGLASSWERVEGGIEFELREGARWHDGRAVTAADVANDLRRWVGRTEHGWLRATRAIASVRAVGARRLRLGLGDELDPLADLCAVNPCSVTGPGSAGTGPLRWVGPREGGRVLRYAFVDDGTPVDLVRFEAEDEDGPVDALLAGDVDVVADMWMESVPRGRIDSLQGHGDLTVATVPGSAVWSLRFRLDGGPTEDAGCRRALAAMVDREALVIDAEEGRARVCSTWAAPGMGAVWPGEGGDAPGGAALTTRTFDLVVPAGDRRRAALGRALVAQFRAGGVDVALREVAAGDGYERVVASGDYDMRLETTWGAPYDPELSLSAAFPAPPADGPRPVAGSPEEFGALVEAWRRLGDPAERLEAARELQRSMDREAFVVPLLVPDRVVVARRGLPVEVAGPDPYHFDVEALRRAATQRARSGTPRED